MIKKFLVVFFILGAAVVFWFSFAIWTGLYSVYTFPPSRMNPDGATIIVSRDEGEPMFNSPQYKAPPKKQERSGGIGFGSMPHAKRPLEQRTIVELPYVEWAYQKSLEQPTPE